MAINIWAALADILFFRWKTAKNVLEIFIILPQKSHAVYRLYQSTLNNKRILIMHPQHFFDEQQNKRWPEINMKIFVLNRGFTWITCFFTKIQSHWQFRWGLKLALFLAVSPIHRCPIWISFLRLCLKNINKSSSNALNSSVSCLYHCKLGGRGW